MKIKIQSFLNNYSKLLFVVFFVFATFLIPQAVLAEISGPSQFCTDPIPANVETCQVYQEASAAHDVVAIAAAATVIYNHVLQAELAKPETEQDKQLIADLQEAIAKAQDAQKRQDPNAKTNGELTCSVFNPTIDCLKLLAAWIGATTVWLASLILWAANQILALALKVSIVDFSNYANSAGVIAFWVIFRDLANMLFIFIMLFIAIGIILDAPTLGGKKALGTLITMAILLNFSMVLPKVVIDISNVATLGFYNKIGTAPANQGETRDITTPFLKQAFGNLQGTSYKYKYQGASTDPNPADGGPNVNAAGTTWKSIIVGTFGMSILILIASWVILVAAIMFIKRTVILIILVATSSIAVFSFSVDYTKDMIWVRWLKQLKQNAIFAPVFMIMFYGVTKIAEDPTLFNNSQGWVAQIITFAILIGLMVSTLIISSRIGDAGASSTSRWGLDKMKGAALGITGGAAAHTIGRTANAIANSKVGNSVAARLPFGTYAKAGLQNIGNSGFGTGSKGYSARLKAQQDQNKATLAGFENREDREAYLARVGKDARGSMFSGMTADEKVSNFSKLGETDQEKLYKGMTVVERAKVNAKLSPARLAKLKSGLAARDQTLTEREDRRLGRTKARTEEIEKINTALEHNDLTSIKDKIGNISTSELKDMSAENIKKMQSHLNSNQLAWLQKNHGETELSVSDLSEMAKNIANDSNSAGFSYMKTSPTRSLFNVREETEAERATTAEKALEEQRIEDRKVAVASRIREQEEKDKAADEAFQEELHDRAHEEAKAEDALHGAPPPPPPPGPTP